MSSHPFSALSGGATNRSSNNGYSQFDPESGQTMGRKKSLIRRERSKRGSASTTSASTINRSRSNASQAIRNYQEPILSSDHSSLAPSHNNMIPLDDLAPPNRNPNRLDPFNSNSTNSSNASFSNPQLSQAPYDHSSPITLRVPPEMGSSSTPQQEIPQPISSQITPKLPQSTPPMTDTGTAIGKEQLGLNDEDIRDEKVPLNNAYSSLPPRRTDLEESHSGFPYWKVFCYIVTFWAPPPFLRLIGLDSPERQYAWREKMGLIAIILCIGAIIAFLTFGFTRTTCVGQSLRLQSDDITTANLIINGRAYDLSSSIHPAAAGIDAGNILYPPVNAGGMDASLLFQNVNGNCKGLITPRSNCSIPFEDENLAWYMPCKVKDLYGGTSPNFTSDYYDGYACHTSTKARKSYYSLKVQGDLYYTWDAIANSSRNLVVYNGHVLDMDLLDWFQTDDLEYPELFDKIRNDDAMQGHDISLLLTEPHERTAANCLVETVKVGVVDVSTIGCIAATIVLYVSLVFVLSIVAVKFFVACYFKWVVSPKQGASYTPIKEMAQRNKKIEEWVNDSTAVNLPVVPQQRRADYHSKQTRRKGIRLTWAGDISEFVGDDHQQPTSSYNPQYITMTTEAYHMARGNDNGLGHLKTHSRMASRQSLLMNSQSNLDLTDPFKSPALLPRDEEDMQTLGTDLISNEVIPQPPTNWEPFNYPLIHTMCLVTCYSEDEEGIRTTMDSIATTDYPNSHKLIVVICDGLITGAGNDKSTPEVCLGLMQDFVAPPEEVQPYSYVSVAQGTKRHNMAKVYAGFYKYSDSVPQEKQQKIPVLLIVKCGTPAEMSSAKPGNRGKRDSQIILMGFLQAITYNERMSELQFEIMKAIWQVTGIMATFYETVLMVDADTLVYPDCLTHMDAEMVKHPEIMGLCGETKISNKRGSWVTAIQVFEYYISHHQSKAFESVFGSVTCLPGCFSMYRIKSPKDYNTWVPILANSDIVEKYSENILDSLHKKNLLLLGEDRYLSSLMLRAFPTRQQVFVPKAACKTVVPDKFKVLLSQRRRWINSTVHNLMELVLVKDLCGAFCFSMQFLIGVELIGTLVLPASITFTLYIIIDAMVEKPTPVMSLVLMAIIFGLPAVLIVFTVSSLSYILWMIIYIFALPIWNFVLPAYAFWKFDDFSWGDTRKTQGGDKGAHGDKDGEFDGSKIVHMTWREYERQRLGIDKRYTIPTVYNPGLYDDTYTSWGGDVGGIGGDRGSKIDLVDMNQTLS